MSSNSDRRALGLRATGSGWRLASVGIAALLSGYAAPALAQETTDKAPPAEDSKADSADVVVVTGTQIRGVAPVGTNVLSIGAADVEESGAFSTNDLLAQIPQITNLYSSLPVGTAGDALPIVRPNIRNLANSGGASTLVLLNGHRVAGQGVIQTSVDPSMIPPAAIAGVEVMPDGGSALYGADAVGGVINFSTRDDLDGFVGGIRYGVGDSFTTRDLDLGYGFKWDGGGASLFYNRSEHDEILGKDRDYIHADNTPYGGTDNRSFLCSPGNITVNPNTPGALTYSIATRTLGAQRCDLNANAGIYPEEARDSVLATLDQRFSDTVKLSVTGYYSKRDGTVFSAPSTLSGNISNTNPYFNPIGAETSHQVQIDFSPVFGASNQSDQQFDTWGIVPTLSIDVGDTWQIRASLNYSESTTDLNARTINNAAATAALAGTTNATALNPYNLAATNPALLATIRDWSNHSIADQTLAEARIVADGVLFAAPGGEAHLAVGFEHGRSTIDQHFRIGPAAAPVTNNISNQARDVDSLFAELQVPLVGASNPLPFVQSLELSVAGRYDDYSTVGSTFNPRYGFSYKPVDDLLIRGNWGTSFLAPSFGDTSPNDGVVQQFAPLPFVGGAAVLPSNLTAPELAQANAFNSWLIILAGGNPDMKPEEAETFSLGADWAPAFAPDFNFSATYWKIQQDDVISVTPFSPLATNLYGNPALAPYYRINATLAQAQAMSTGLNESGLLGGSWAAFYGLGQQAGAIWDLRRGNFGSRDMDGIDLRGDYYHQTDFGAIFGTLSATRVLNDKQTPVPGSAAVDGSIGNNEESWSANGSIGIDLGPFTSRLSVSYAPGYDALGPVEKVDSFTLVDLFFKYGFEDEQGWLNRASIGLNIDNVFDQDPPYRNDADGYAGYDVSNQRGFGTLGRVVSISLRKGF